MRGGGVGHASLHLSERKHETFSIFKMEMIYVFLFSKYRIEYITHLRLRIHVFENLVHQGCEHFMPIKCLYNVMT